MSQGKRKENNTEKEENLQDIVNFEYRLAKDFIRACITGGMSDPVTMNLINQGVLGVEINKDGTPKRDDKNKVITKKISRATYYIWKKDAISLDSIQADFTDFVKIDYAVQIAGVKSMLQVLINIMFKAVMAESDSVKQARIAHNLFQDMPSYTQFLDIEKKAIQHGKISLKDLKKNENSQLATSN